MTHLRCQEPSVPVKPSGVLYSTFVVLSDASYKYVKSDYKTCRIWQDLTEKSFFGQILPNPAYFIVGFDIFVTSIR